MYPPSSAMNLNIDAISGILGSISIACWIVVFSPQIIKNFQLGSADGLSVVFIVIWSAGDIFNVLGGVLQGVLPTMLILAVYYCFVDIFLIGQCFYYKGFTLTDTIKPRKSSNGHPKARTGAANETSPLLTPNPNGSDSTRPPLDRVFSNLSPANPLLPDSKPITSTPASPPPQRTLLQSFLFNSSAVVIVCAAGVAGWYLSSQNPSSHHHGHGNDKSNPTDALEFNTLGQVFGYICAALYLGSRIPQLLLNYRRKGTEGISMLFFLFACIGNLTYVLSIFAYDPSKACGRGARHCRQGEEGRVYRRYIAVNFSWLLGSFGTLFLDLGVFVQYFMWDHGREGAWGSEEGEEGEDVVGEVDEDALEVRVQGGSGRRRRDVAFVEA
ncbi:PQ-loop-domain-containing protein [Tothia fuscella]|uniref:PQ-loop-domain-containing protein n=1 Tax=Tothia fuscella TaxID=1048955 RepID=A0A9P4TZQ2_9PEZI|nr:PQ-loop-domain-containing protein [Tothia fuscella]